MSKGLFRLCSKLSQLVSGSALKQVKSLEYRVECSRVISFHQLHSLRASVKSFPHMKTQTLESGLAQIHTLYTSALLSTLMILA